MAQLNTGHFLRVVSSILDSVKELMSGVTWFGEQLLRKCEIIFKKLAAIELRQCHDGLTENEAVRLLEQEFKDWVPEISMDYFHRQFQYFMWNLHTVRKGLSIATNDQLQGELLTIHLKYNLKQQRDWNGEITNKLRIMSQRNMFFKGLADLETPLQLHKEMN